ncbi:hypothetical protein [Candidatus Colwellia aromaticivorans]|uniref:hypothetical protein n=1 Tax=Candidatus Colwellia aromaticivorans TaxID=2267621 RepID=UPI000DF1BC8B|nr:hypothetical protein [Candidatus Colwellia aromaticivorans]
MNISSASSQNSIFGLTNQTNTSKKSLVRSVDPVVVPKAEQETLLNKQANQGIVADQQAIALFEKNQLEANAAKYSLNSSTFSTTDKDKPSPKNETAVASYQTVGNLAQRESVQQLFGVDVFA